MEQLVHKYAQKLVRAGLAEPGAPLVGGLDAELVWNREDEAAGVLEDVFRRININSILLSRPAEPYRSIIDFLASQARDAVMPTDCETRTFLHDLPVRHEFAAGAVAEALKHRKSVIVPGRGVVTFGTVSPEQAFVTFSSVCFACFVKFFSDYLSDTKRGRASDEQRRLFDKVRDMLEILPDEPGRLMSAPFESEEEIYRAVSEAGRVTVENHLVDSYFGNVSYRWGDTLYISQTASSLDELEGCIDPCPLDGSSCAGVTASSELSAHRQIVENTPNRAVLHGHPKFSVIVSMNCDRDDCGHRGECHIRCPEERFVGDVPVVTGEVGMGPRGLARTLPPAIRGRRGGIVYGHGVFTTGETDFNEAWHSLLDIERTCREEYFRRLPG